MGEMVFLLWTKASLLTPDTVGRFGSGQIRAPCLSGVIPEVMDIP